ncbi:MAG TPA: hypothetical protein ENI15_06095 [Spirochaetes bacterium]|nr:hypothetical protein [Spirochaetota bacterium]
MGDAINSTDYLPYSREMVNGIGVAGPPAEEAQSNTEQVDVSSEKIENIDEEIGGNVDVVV